MFVLVNRIRKMLKFEPGKDRVNFFFSCHKHGTKTAKISNVNRVMFVDRMRC